MKLSFAIICSLAILASCNLSKKDEEDSSTQDDAGASSSGQGTGNDTDTSTDDTIDLAAPSNFADTDRASSLTTTPTLSWDAVEGASSYKVAIGTTPGAIDVLGWTDVGNVTSAQVNASLPNGVMLYSSVRAVAADGTEGDPSEGDGWQNLRCPTASDPEGEYIKIYGDTTAGLGGRHYDNGTQTLLDWTGANAGNSWTPTKTTRSISDFCVAKYEMKLAHDDEGADGVVDDPTASVPSTYDWETDHDIPAEKAKYKPVSVPQALPWIEIKTGLAGTIGAAQACENLGSGYRLINNAQWQRIARDIEATQDNWYDGGTPGDDTDDFINRGNSDSVGMVGDADATDSDPCIGTGNADCLNKSNVTDFPQKRTHSLTNAEGGDVWDLAGNAWEWTSDLNHRVDGHGAAGADADGYQSVEPYVGDSASDLDEFKLQWGPSGEHTGKIPAGNPEYGGFGYFFDDNTPGGGSDPASPGAVIRGGYWFIGADSGVFFADLNYVPSNSFTGISFRCVLAP